MASPVSGVGSIGTPSNLTEAQQAEINAVFKEALAPGSTLTKAQAQAKFDAIKASLGPEQQANIVVIAPTALPDLPSNFSAEAQKVGNEIKAVVLNQDNTVAQDRDAVKAIIANASPSVQAELQSVAYF